MNTQILAVVNGIFKSVTMWDAGAIATAAQILPDVTPDDLVAIGVTDPVQVAKTMTRCALLMAACRFITSKSLAHKGGLTPVEIQSTGERVDAIIQPAAPPTAPVATPVTTPGESNAKP